MQEKVWIAALAGLLHDIGKFAFRADAPLDEISRGFGEQDYGKHGAHARWSIAFVHTYVPETWRSQLAAVLYHHKPNDHLSKVVALADRLSSGERSDEAEEQPMQQLSVFCRLQADRVQLKNEQYVYWPLKALEFGQAGLFPGPTWPGPEVKRAYGALWHSLDKDAASLFKAHALEGDLPCYLESLLLLLQRYAWCVPSAYYRAQPDVSLYDHSRRTAALAAIIVNRSEAEVDAMLEALRSWYYARRGAAPAGHSSAQPAAMPAVLTERPVACLVGGDISGVQDFIYTITSRGATSALRGRSFYLQLLTEAIARYVLRELGMPITNLIYGGGGHFYLLVPPDTDRQLADLRKAVSRVLLHHHSADLYVALGSQPLCAADFFEGRISQRWEGLSATLRRAKEHRFSELGPDMHPLVFRADTDQGNQEKECQVCGREHPDTRVIEEVRKCPQCLSYEKLGDQLRAAHFLRLDELRLDRTDGTGEPGTWSDVLAELGLAAWVGAELPQASPASNSVRSTLLALSDEAVDRLVPGPKLAVGRRMLVNVTPTFRQEDHDQVVGKVEGLPRVDSVKPFSVMAEQAKGIKRLGILRMDVDNLGRLFSEGFKGSEDNIGTLSRVAALSFAMSMFFEGWLERLIEQTSRENGGAERLYSIYAGGDDLFVIGSWDTIPVLALAIRDHFARFAANHPGVHLSGGIALVPDKYPLYQAADDAKQAEDKAKGYRDESGKKVKNAITFLGKTVHWDTFVQVRCLADKLHVLCNQERRAPQALLRTLINLQEQHDQALARRAREGEDRNQANQPQTCFGPWIPRAAYMLARMRDRHKGAKQELQELADSLTGNNFAAISWIGLAARWAELLGRRTERRR